jgi:hypothetical protein
VPNPAADARFKVRVMEGVLERAVEHAAMVMNQQLRTVSPDLVLLTGAARVRGYRLDGYGLFFDVQVPAALRQSMGWTVRMMRQNNENVEQALTVFKRMIETLHGKARDDAALALRQIELQVKPPMIAGPGTSPLGVPPLLAPEPAQPALPPAVGQAASGVQVTSTSLTAEAAVTPPAAPAAAPGDRAEPPVPPVNPLIIQNPDLAYELEVREAIIAAMLEWGATLPLESGEWLTVAARDNEDVVIPGEAAEVVTIIMRVRGSDLTEFRAGRLSPADVRRRVEVREF